MLLKLAEDLAGVVICPFNTFLSGLHGLFEVLVRASLGLGHQALLVEKHFGLLVCRLEYLVGLLLGLRDDAVSLAKQVS